MSLIIAIQFLMLCLGLYFVVKGADVLLSSATALGKKFKVSDFFIGLIIIGFGTSLPELLVSIKAVLENSPNLSFGNVVGSNISNIVLVLGSILLISHIQFKNLKKFDIFFHLLIHLIFFIIFYYFKFDAVFGLLFIVTFIFYIFKSFKNSSSNEVKSIEIDNDLFSKLSFKKPLRYGIPIILLSIIITLLGAQITVSSAIEISNILNISESFLGLSIIAIGTSLPEIAASIQAVKRRKLDIIIGNIIGSNIYNLLLILGASSLFQNFNYDKNILTYEIIFLLICLLILSFLLAINFKLKKKYSFIFIFLYLLYLYNLFETNF